MKPIPVVTIIGRSRSGKTTLMEALISELSHRGYRIATIKHHSHLGFEVDWPGKDSWRHARAGSVHVIIAAPDKIASYRQLDIELPLAEIVHEVHDADLILVEGYKEAGCPSLEVMRSELGGELIGNKENLLGIITDVPMDLPYPQFGFKDTFLVADLIEERFLQRGA
jgi:molybdopterin-guanine dinucleotide biosynthesis protein B